MPQSCGYPSFFRWKLRLYLVQRVYQVGAPMNRVTQHLNPVDTPQLFRWRLVSSKPGTTGVPLLANLVQWVYQVGAPVNRVTKRPNPVVTPASSGGNCPILMLARIVSLSAPILWLPQLLQVETVPF
jgi:hypothetical protein